MLMKCSVSLPNVGYEQCNNFPAFPFLCSHKITEKTIVVTVTDKLSSSTHAGHDVSLTGYATTYIIVVLPVLVDISSLDVGKNTAARAKK